MKEPDPPDDLEQTILESFNELHAEAQIVPMVLLFPPEVIECIKTYTEEHSLDPATLIPLAMKAIHDSGGSRWIEEIELLMEDPDSFEWPLEDPLLCVAIAFMRKYANRWTDKVRERLGLIDDESDPADWWKTP